MTDLEAKDFLVHQALEQAALERVPFSDLERRMMYFTESGEMPEDILELNAAFEAEYDSAEYENKVAKLMRQALVRLKKESPSSARDWEDAVLQLSKGDHYVLLLIGDTSIGYAKRQKLFGWSFQKLLGIGILILVVVMVVCVAIVHNAESGLPQ
jgi:hypothetical protein